MAGGGNGALWSGMGISTPPLPRIRSSPFFFAGTWAVAAAMPVRGRLGTLLLGEPTDHERHGNAAESAAAAFGPEITDVSRDFWLPLTPGPSSPEWWKSRLAPVLSTARRTGTEPSPYA